MGTRRVLATALLSVLLWPAAAVAHAFLVKSAPAPRAVLNHPPARVELWFNERLEPAYSSVSVADDAGIGVDLRDVQVGPDDPKKLSVSLSILGPGRYTVNFRVLSVDGHVVESSFPFAVKEPR